MPSVACPLDKHEITITAIQYHLQGHMYDRVKARILGCTIV